MVLNLERFFNLKNSLSQFFLFLLAFAGLATFDAFGSEPVVLTQLVLIAVTAFCCVYFLREVKQVTMLNPLNFFISALIIHILIHPTDMLLYPMFALVVLALIKMLHGRRQPIFNPAACALFTTFYISVLLQKFGLVRDTLLISWWGADMNQAFLNDIPLLQIFASAGLLIGFIYFMLQYRKGMLVSVFFMTVMGCVFYANISGAHSSGATIDFLVTSIFNSFAFMLMVMIPEPKTSSSFVKQQALVGVFGGFLFYVLTFVFPTTQNGFILTILGMNLLTYCLKQGQLLQR